MKYINFDEWQNETDKDKKPDPKTRIRKLKNIPINHIDEYEEDSYPKKFELDDWKNFPYPYGEGS